MNKFKIKNLFSNASFFFLGAVFCSVLGVGAACLPNLAATNVTYSNDKSKSAAKIHWPMWLAQRLAVYS